MRTRNPAPANAPRGGTARQKVDHASRRYRLDLLEATPSLDKKVRAGGYEDVAFRVFLPRRAC